jgi:succinate dehydrogenase/fumarate reductase-like Fe-S protein
MGDWIMAKDETQSITVKVMRKTPKEKEFSTYKVPKVEGQSVLGVLKYIYDNIDPGLGFNYSCRIGLCSSCISRVNGKVVLACTTLANDDLVIEPYKEGAAVRDLITELPPVIKSLI